MNTIAFFSAKGAPGTTTTAMLVASLWPRPALLADCDPSGGDVGLRLPSPEGRPLDLFRGLLSLLPVARRSLEPSALLDHAQHTLGGGEVLVGMSGPEQAAAGGPVWATLADAFAGLPSHDVILDLGRLDARSPVLPLALSAQLVVCVLEATLTSVYASRARLRSLLPSLVGMDGGGPTVGVVVRAKDLHEAEQSAAVLQEEFPNVVFFGHLVADPVGARIFDGLPVSRPERTLLVRSGAALVGAMTGELDRRRAMAIRPAAAVFAPQPLVAPTAEPPAVAAAGERPRTRSEARRARHDEQTKNSRSRFGRKRDSPSTANTAESSQA